MLPNDGTDDHVGPYLWFIKLHEATISPSDRYLFTPIFHYMVYLQEHQR